MAIDPTLKRGDITTFSIPRELKERLNDVTGEDQTPAEWLSDLLREDVIEGLQRFRRPGDSLGDVIVRLTHPKGRSSDEFETFMREARALRDNIDGNSITVDQ